MELISTGTLDHHLFFDQGINPLLTFRNSYMDTRPTEQTANTLHSCHCLIGKPHPSFCPSFSLNTFPATLCICSLSEAEQTPEASKEIIFILCSPTTLPYPERSYTTEPSWRWTLLQNQSLFINLPKFPPVTPLTPGHALKSTSSPLLKAVGCSDIPKGSTAPTAAGSSANMGK